MKTLAEFNAEAMTVHTALQALSQPHANGIQCPKCPGELWDSNPMMILTSNPPQMNVHCPECGYVGYRYA